MNQIIDMLPDSRSWNLEGRCAQELLQKSLVAPLHDFFTTPGKNFRSRLVEAGFRLSLEEEPALLSTEIRNKLITAGQIVELIHAGSLIVDDIQDNSQYRRKLPCLHIKHGLPLALNAGNLLYFWALEQINKLSLKAEEQNSLVQDILHLMCLAHAGQALDIGTKIDEIEKDHVHETCLSAMRLKTGALMGLALRLGSAVGGGNISEDMQNMGLKFGILLQMFDDLGNFSLKQNDSKRLEDLLLRRPGWIWVVASSYPDLAYNEFKKAVQNLPDEELLHKWMEEYNFLSKLKCDTHLHLNELRNFIKDKWGKSHIASVEILKHLMNELEEAYVS